MAHQADSCLSPQTSAAYLDNRLSAREREAATVHLASCETCYFLFTEAAQTMPQPAAAVLTSPRWWTRPAVVWPATGALAAAATVFLAFSLSLLPWQRS